MWKHYKRRNNSMLQKQKITTKKVKNNYISECVVVDTETNETFYVVTQFGDLLYATFTSSWLDYATGKVSEEPQRIEGEDYLFFDLNNDNKETKFWEFYVDTFNEASHLEHTQYINRKYANMKKPIGNIKYEIVYKNNKPVFGCGPMGDIYEIKFHILDDDSYLYVYSDDAFGYMSIHKFSVFELLEKDDDVSLDDDCEEMIEKFSDAKKSKYYDLYLEMEKFKDNY